MADAARTAALLVAATAMATGAARADIVNGGFETGDFTGWSTIGNASIQTASYGAGPAEGKYDALLQTAGGVDAASLQSFFNLPSYLLSTTPDGAAIVAGSAIKQTFSTPQLISGLDALHFAADFLTNELSHTSFASSDAVGFAVLYSSPQFVTVYIFNGTFSPLRVSATPYALESGYAEYEPNGFGIPPFVTEIGFGVITSNPDAGSALLVDAVAVPEPGALGLLLAGASTAALVARVRRG